jgi:Copper type II ascorbate-dependent monooxygenase, C-terminal domain
MKIKNYIYLLITIVLSSCGAEPQQITFSEHIAPIIYKNCSSCHRPGEAGPFSLLTYQDVKSRSALMKFVTKTRFMPPWPADASYTHFVDEKVLTQDEIDLIVRWVDEGCAIGDSSKIPPIPIFPKGSQLGTPDFVIKFRDVYKIKGNNQDQFLLMRIPYEIPEDKFISVIEVIPDNRKLLHHINAQLLSYEFEKKKDVFPGRVFVNLDSFPDKLIAYKELGLANDDGLTFPMLTQSVTNYLPGVTPPLYPDGIGGFKMTRKGALFLKDIHYGPSRVDTTDETFFNVFFAKQPSKRPTQEFQMGTFGISPTVPELIIPPNEIKTFTSTYQVPFDISILTVNPHMHLLGKTFWAYAVSLKGDTIPLIKINKWDFRWQYFYTFKKMVKIPKGSTIHTVGVFDNTRENPNNPFSPPQLVSEREGSMRTSDEMFQFIVTYLPYMNGDENISLDR